MSAGENDSVDFLAPGSIKHRLRSRANRFYIDLITGKFCFCKFDQLGRPMPNDGAIAGKALS
jgi:hypothetical protein